MEFYAESKNKIKNRVLHLKKHMLYSPHFFEAPCILYNNFKMCILTFPITFIFNIFCKSQNKGDNDLTLSLTHPVHSVMFINIFFTFYTGTSCSKFHLFNNFASLTSYSFTSEFSSSSEILLYKFELLNSSSVKFKITMHHFGRRRSFPSLFKKTFGRHNATEIILTFDHSKQLLKQHITCKRYNSPFCH